MAIFGDLPKGMGNFNFTGPSFASGMGNVGNAMARFGGSSPMYGGRRKQMPSQAQGNAYGRNRSFGMMGEAMNKMPQTADRTNSYAPSFNPNSGFAGNFGAGQSYNPMPQQDGGMFQRFRDMMGGNTGFTGGMFGNNTGYAGPLQNNPNTGIAGGLDIGPSGGFGQFGAGANTGIAGGLFNRNRVMF